MVDGILGLAPTMMGVGLLGENLSYLNKKKKKKKGSLASLGMTNIVGATMIGAVAGTI